MIVCVGGGSFGAAAAIAARDMGDDVLVIDPDVECEASSHATRIVRSVDDVGNGVNLLIGEAIDVIDEVLARDDVDLVVPASPGHLFAHMLVAKGLVPTSVERIEWRDVVHWDEASGVIVLSRMHDGRCLDGCDQPDVCPVTGSDSPPMWDIARGLGEILAPLCVVLRTRSIGGVGAINADDLREGISDALSAERVAVATSCRCHAVLNVLERTT